MILNLNMEPTFIVETMGLQWTSELTFAENVPALMKQFKKERGLKPFKVMSNNSLSPALLRFRLVCVFTVILVLLVVLSFYTTGCANGKM